ncbi:MAG: helix-turn-helix domain-containing protein [Clostridia bacterium]|nr:helix-turn-helix domain-containing protein [Clostridia bacterium]
MKVDGRKARKLREERGYKLASFAGKSGLSTSYVSKIERGHTNPSLKTIQKIADVLNVDKSQLIMSDKDDIGGKIRHVRTKKKLSLANVAEKVGVSPSYISEIERGNARPSIGTLRKLSEVLDIGLEKLVGENYGLGVKIRNLRQEQGMTQAELAQGADVSAGLIGQIENNRVQPSLQTIEKIAKVFGVSPCYFLLDDNMDLDHLLKQMNPDLRNLLCDEKVQSVLRLVCNCSEKELKFIFNFIKLYKSEGAVIK